MIYLNLLICASSNSSFPSPFFHPFSNPDLCVDFLSSRTAEKDAGLPSGPKRSRLSEPTIFERGEREEETSASREGKMPHE